MIRNKKGYTAQRGQRHACSNSFVALKLSATEMIKALYRLPTCRFASDAPPLDPIQGLRSIHLDPLHFIWFEAGVEKQVVW